VEVCPYGAIRLAPWGLNYGTPVVDPDQSPCRLCMRCPEVCPTRALEPLAKEDVQMGVAVVMEEDCLAFQGVVCGLCAKRCPLPGVAIELDDFLQPRVLDGCVGCGVCQHVCPTEPIAIGVIPYGDL
jgi:ferredoxin-type protein NapG